ncbi:unnamed protein product [Cuscuta campestris]|uniref:Uncharacterized protein n=1 Tax=Cuscuta campestris TaxID=132261 RepID=A0A484KBG7_9ASTE|nr:unnamed protein product [Cuscuta campestris]
MLPLRTKRWVGSCIGRSGGATVAGGVLRGLDRLRNCRNSGGGLCWEDRRIGQREVRKIGWVCGLRCFGSWGGNSKRKLGFVKGNIPGVKKTGLRRRKNHPAEGPKNKMVCFLSCFGIQKKHKQRKPANKTQRLDTVEGKYLPLDFRKSGEPDPKTRFSRNARRGSLADKIKKKVTFNLDVKIYGPLQQEEIDSYFSDDGQEKSESEYPSDYRYYSCRDSFDGDDIKLDESDIEEEYIDEGDDFDNGVESNNGSFPGMEISMQATKPYSFSEFLKQDP